MKLKKLALVFAMMAAAVASSAAWADHRNHRHQGHSSFRFGVSVGVPLGWGYSSPSYYSPSYYSPYYSPYYPAAPQYYPYYTPQVVVQPAPVYVERADVQAAPAAQDYWYYCAPAKGYYPYVRECPSEWQAVAPQPQQAPASR